MRRCDARGNLWSLLSILGERCVGEMKRRNSSEVVRIAGAETYPFTLPATWEIRSRTTAIACLRT
jgi:hypothetical protein